MNARSRPNYQGIGAPLRRVEDRRFLLGRGRFVADIDLPGALHCALVRSPHAHARIRAIDTSAAIASPGVTAVFTGADMAADGMATMEPMGAGGARGGAARGAAPARRGGGAARRAPPQGPPARVLPSGNLAAAFGGSRSWPSSPPL